MFVVGGLVNKRGGMMISVSGLLDGVFAILFCVGAVWLLSRHKSEHDKFLDKLREDEIKNGKC